MLHGTAHLPEWPGVPVADDEGRIISGALGGAKSILLANHGLLTAGASIEEATYLAVFFERAARMQIRAMAAGGYKEVKPELAEEARDFLLQPSIVRGTFAYWARRTPPRAFLIPSPAVRHGTAERGADLSCVLSGTPDRGLPGLWKDLFFISAGERSTESKPPFSIYYDLVSVPHECERPTDTGFGRDIADHHAARGAGERPSVRVRPSRPRPGRRAAP